MKKAHRTVEHRMELERRAKAYPSVTLGAAPQP